MTKPDTYSAQAPLIKTMKALGYNPSDVGVCAGASIVALEIALNEGSMDKFNRIMAYLQTHDDFAKQIEHLKTKRTTEISNYYNTYELELISRLPSNDINQAVIGKIYLSSEGSYVIRDPAGKVQTGSLKDSGIKLNDLTNQLKDETLKKDNLKKDILKKISEAGHAQQKPAPSEDEAFLFEILGVLDQCYLYQYPEKFYHLFALCVSQHTPQLITPLVHSNKSKIDKGLLSDPSWTWTGVYDEKSLESLLRHVANAAHGHRLAMTLTGLDHALQIPHKITLVYQDNHWECADIEAMPSGQYKRTTDLVNDISNALQMVPSKQLALGAMVFSTGREVEQTARMIQTIKQSEKFKKIQAITPAQIKRSPESMLALAELAISFNQLDTLEALLNAGLDPNADLPIGGTMAYIAAQLGNVEVLKLLVEKKVNLHQTYQDITPLLVAVANQHVSVVTYLLTLPDKIKPNVNQSTPDGRTPLIMAIKRGNLDLVKLLVEHGANCKQPSPYGTPIEIADDLLKDKSIRDYLVEISTPPPKQTAISLPHTTTDTPHKKQKGRGLFEKFKHKLTTDTPNHTQVTDKKSK